MEIDHIFTTVYDGIARLACDVIENKEEHDAIYTELHSFMQTHQAIVTQETFVHRIVAQCNKYKTNDAKQLFHHLLQSLKPSPRPNALGSCGTPRSSSSSSYESDYEPHIPDPILF